MQKSDNKPYALLAGVCYAIYGLYNMINEVTYVLQNSEHASISAQNIIFWIAMIGMAVALFLKNEKAVVAAAAVSALLNLFELYGFIKYSVYYYFLLEYLTNFIAYALVVVLILLTLKKKTVVKRIWFTSGATMPLGHLIACWKNSPRPFISLFGLIEIGGLILIGLWLKGHDLIPAKAKTPNEYPTFDPHTVYSAPLSDTAIGSADKLKMYNELLESGPITQEEFDVKKKQILGF